MKKAVFSSLFIAVVATAFNSCGKHEEGIKLLKTISYSSDRAEKYEVYRFEYDAQNRITKFYQYGYTNTFTYEGDDLVHVFSTNNSESLGTFEYTKNGNTITEIYTYNSNGSFSSNYTNTSIIELGDEGLPVRMDVKRADGNTFFRIYEYQDGNLTIDKIIYSFIVEDDYYTERQIYTYDDKKGALYYCQTPKWYLILYLNDFGIKNNVTHSGGTWPPRTWYTYEYHNSEFPAKRTVSTSGHMTHSEGIEEFIYITK